MKKEIIDVEEIEETEEKGFIDKAKKFVQENGKKIAAGIAVIGTIGLAIGIALNNNKKEDSDYEDEFDVDVIDDSQEDEEINVEEVEE